MKNEKKEYVILSDVISMDEMDLKEEKKEFVEEKIQKEESMSSIKKEFSTKSKNTEERSEKKFHENASIDDKKKNIKDAKPKKNRKTKKKEKLEKREAIKAIKAETSAEIAAARQKQRVVSEEEKAEVKELLQAEINATKADILQLMKSETKAEDEKAKEQKAKEQKAKEQKVKEQKVKEQKAKEQRTKEQKAKEQKAKEQKAKEQKAKEQKAKEQKAKEQKAKEQKAKEQKAKEQKAKEQKVEEQKAKVEKENYKNAEEGKNEAVLLAERKIEEAGNASGIDLKTVEPEDSKTPKEHKSIKELLQDTKFLLGSLVVIFVLIAYCSVAYNYRETFFMRTTINGIDCAGMTAEDAEKALKEKVEDYELEIAFRDGAKEIISGESINYKYVSDGSVKKLMDNQMSFLWLFYLIFPAKYEVAESIEFDRGLLAQEYYALESTSPEKNIAPSNAYVTYEGDKFIVVPEDEGNQIDHHAFILKINEVVDASGTRISAQDYDIYARPTVFRDSADLAKECEQLNELAVVSVTYTLANGEYVMDGNEVRNWLKVDEQGNYSITEEEMAQAIKDFVDRFADEVNTVGTERPFKATKQGDITVSGGTYGWKINKKEEIAKLTEEIANRAIVTREPCYSSREVTAENNGFGDTYIEIDLTNQHLWYYIDGELYVESDFVSGTYHNASRRTPGGIFLLTYKQKDRVLRGEQKEDGTYEYESPVSFWMPFNRGIGLHDASWRGSFGGTIYKYSGSHGCINLPYKKAQTIYSEIDKETPIICFY